MTRTLYVLALAAPALLAISGCTHGSGGAHAGPSPVEVTRGQAVDVLHQVVAKAPGRSAGAFCKAVTALQRQSCEDAWQEADHECLKPGGVPRVLRGATVPATDTTDGGYVLLIEGRTAGGSTYVSELFVTAPEGEPVASLGVFWSGIGLGDSPLGEDGRVVPRPECARN